MPGTGKNQDELERLATNLRVERALLEALTLLDGLSPVVFKGPVLSRMIFGDLTSRASADNDIWIQRSFAEVALTRLLAAGYRSLPGLDAHRALQRYGQVALWLKGDLDAVSLDLHMEPFSGRFFDVSEETLRSHLQCYEVHGAAIQTFDRPLALSHLVAHFVQHHLALSQLKNFAHAFSAWGQEVHAEMRNLAPTTCTWSGFEYCVWLAGQRGLIRRTPWPQSTQARLVAQLGGQKPWEKHTLVRKFLSVLLVAPKKLPSGIYSSVCLDKDDLHCRYGDGGRALLLARHFRTLLQR